jgi:hypothetical protein
LREIEVEIETKREREKETDKKKAHELPCSLPRDSCPSVLPLFLPKPSLRELWEVQEQPLTIELQLH